jgi:hypothetical protein
MAAPKRRQGMGLGVDAAGGPVVDPTENVLALVGAESKRQDDLRTLSNQLQDEKNKCTKEIAELHSRYASSINELRANHARELGAAESKRLDSIRQVDVLAVATTAAQSLQAIQALAATTQTNAENVRKDLATTADTIAKSTATTVGALSDRIAALEKSSYEGAGKERISDPMIVELMSQVKALANKEERSSGKSQGVQITTSTLIAVVVALIAIATFLLPRIGK